MHTGPRRFATLVACVGTLVASLALPAEAREKPKPKPPAGTDRAHYILPPGNYGGVPTTVNSRDQLPLYDGLTPLRGNVTDADIESHFLPEDFRPVGPTRIEPTGRPGTTITYDSYGVAHVKGVTRADLAYGAGWVTARDRGLLLQLGRGPARVAVADVPGINAFGLVTSGQSFVPSAATEQLVTDQVELIRSTYGKKGEEIIADAQAQADGANAYWASVGTPQSPPVGVNDVIATTAFIGSIFGAGGGGEASNADLLAKLQASLGEVRGYQAWDDAMLFDDPEAPTTTRKRFDYGVLTGGGTEGSVVMDPGSIVSFDPRQGPTPRGGPAVAPAPDTTRSSAEATTPIAPVEEPETAVSSATLDAPGGVPAEPDPDVADPTGPPSTEVPPADDPAGGTTTVPTTTGTAAPQPTDVAYPAAGPVPAKQASNFLVVSPKRSATDNALAVMGPQLGYYYPEIVQQIHLSGPGVEAQGVAVPGAAMYLLIGRTQDYAWSLTSANHDVRDVFAEQLCNADGSAPTRQSTGYVYKGACTPFEQFDAGTLNGTPISYPVSVHGPVIGTALVDGQPFALTRKRSTFGRDGLNLAALKDMTEGKASTSKRFFKAANQFGFTFNWAYASRTETAFFSSGLLPKRARGLDRRLPTLGNGDYEWKGFLNQKQHPQDVGGPDGLLLNWNNQAAPGFMHGDDTPFGSEHRVELFDKYAKDVTLAQNVSVMNRAATEDVRSTTWPVVSRLLRTGPAPTALDAKLVSLLDEWVWRDAPRLDADLDGRFDDAGPTILDALWRPVAEAVVRPVYGDLTGDLDRVRGLGGLSGQSIVDKDLRSVMGEWVKGPFELDYCGNGDLAACRASLWAAVHEVGLQLSASQGPDPRLWRSTASRTGFQPGLIPDTIRTTNRPTFQQVLEFADAPRRGR